MESNTEPVSVNVLPPPKSKVAATSLSVQSLDKKQTIFDKKKNLRALGNQYSIEDARSAYMNRNEMFRQRKYYGSFSSMNTHNSKSAAYHIADVTFQMLAQWHQLINETGTDNFLNTLRAAFQTTVSLGVLLPYPLIYTITIGDDVFLIGLETMFDTFDNDYNIGYTKTFQAIQITSVGSTSNNPPPFHYPPPGADVDETDEFKLLTLEEQNNAATSTYDRKTLQEQHSFLTSAPTFVQTENVDTANDIRRKLRRVRKTRKERSATSSLTPIALDNDNEDNEDNEVNDMGNNKRAQRANGQKGTDTQNADDDPTKDNTNITLPVITIDEGSIVVAGSSAIDRSYMSVLYMYLTGLSQSKKLKMAIITNDVLLSVLISAFFDSVNCIDPHSDFYVLHNVTITGAYSKSIVDLINKVIYSASYDYPIEPTSQSVQYHDKILFSSDSGDFRRLYGKPLFAHPYLEQFHTNIIQYNTQPTYEQAGLIIYYDDYSNTNFVILGNGNVPRFVGSTVTISPRYYSESIQDGTVMLVDLYTTLKNLSMDMAITTVVIGMRCSFTLFSAVNTLIKNDYTNFVVIEISPSGDYIYKEEDYPYDHHLILYSDEVMYQDGIIIKGAYLNARRSDNNQVYMMLGGVEDSITIQNYNQILDWSFNIQNISYSETAVAERIYDIFMK